MKYVVNTNYLDVQDFLTDCIINYDTKGENFGNQKRNSLRLFKLGAQTINIKSFKVPNIVNQIAYKFFRKSKAQRSYEYASKLIDLGIQTPEPIGYYEFTSLFLFKKSYYISTQLDCDLTYRELTRDLNYPEHDRILRAFTRFTFTLHERNIKFLDHSPGNTLIKKEGDAYHFYLVDLNRMEFKPMSFEERIKNFSRLTTHKSMVKTMSDEYAKLSGEDFNTVYSLMWQETKAFQDKSTQKKALKKKLRFWKA
ncbi:Kdo domain containing protein [Formosa sediminum]|uniref:Kdo domain containing protein n=1 Tax=Formosa sediminum TaxID=2594004 RepID=A0A516GQZ2_9FLAO|nr:lipopolysaccharide kinase InaA family protein [Formosa sediminum]QDO93954.1 Kdo domain containing protein [Formosa sediminum]